MLAGAERPKGSLPRAAAGGAGGTGTGGSGAAPGARGNPPGVIGAGARAKPDWVPSVMPGRRPGEVPPVIGCGGRGSPDGTFPCGRPMGTPGWVTGRATGCGAGRCIPAIGVGAGRGRSRDPGGSGHRLRHAGGGRRTLRRERSGGRGPRGLGGHRLARARDRGLGRRRRGRGGHGRAGRHHRLPGGQPDQRPDAVEEGLALERLGDVGIRAGGAGPGLIERLEVAGQEQHRSSGGARIGLERLADLVAAPARHQHVGDDEVGPHLAGAGNGIDAVVHGGDLEIFEREHHPDDLADGERVIGDEQGLRHVRP